MIILGAFMLALAGLGAIVELIPAQYMNTVLALLGWGEEETEWPTVQKKKRPGRRQPSRARGKNIHNQRIPQ